jgi:hypothetical protein
MNIQNFLFKIAVIIIQTLKITVIITPLVMAIRALRSVEFELIQELPAAIFIAFGLGMSLTVWNALDFENYKKMDPKQYLKSNQHMPIELTKEVNPAKVFNQITQAVEENKNWKLISQSASSIKILATSPYKFKDIIEIENSGENKLLIKSKPRSFFWLIDLGRNYKNILSVLRVIKETPL